MSAAEQYIIHGPGCNAVYCSGYKGPLDTYLCYCVCHNDARGWSDEGSDGRRIK